jgi:hypothetical protein
MKVVPLTLDAANELVRGWHRHHKPVQGHRFSIGAMQDGQLVGACIVGRPQARMVDQYSECSVTRLVTFGGKNVCSFLYGAAVRIAKEMGFDQIRTEILASEPGTSLKAAGWKFSHMTSGGKWSRPSRERKRTEQEGPKQVWIRKLRGQP